MANQPIRPGSSALDVPGIVKSLTTKKRETTDKALAFQRTTTTTRISAIGNFSASLAQLQSALKGLGDGSAFSARKVSTGEAGVLTAMADGKALRSTYRIVVDKLAAAQVVTSAAVDGRNAAVGQGALTITMGARSMRVEIAPPGNTLQDIAARINAAADNPGVSATIVTGRDGAHLAVTSLVTGRQGAFSIAASGGDGGLSKLDFDPATDQATLAPQDAELSVNGVPVTSPSNLVASAIVGVTLSLDKVGTSSVVIQDDNAAVARGVTSLVDAYNRFLAQYRVLTAYDATKGEVGALNGDSTIVTIKAKLTALLPERSPAARERPNSLSDLGVTFRFDGTLALDTGKLTKALDTDPRQVRHLLGGSQGVASRLDELIGGWTSKNGILSRRAADLQGRIKAIDRKAAAFETSMQAYSTRIARQYTSLDTLMTRLENTGAYLQRQFDVLSSRK